MEVLLVDTDQIIKYLNGLPFNHAREEFFEILSQKVTCFFKEYKEYAAYHQHFEQFFSVANIPTISIETECEGKAAPNIIVNLEVMRSQVESTMAQTAFSVIWVLLLWGESRKFFQLQPLARQSGEGVRMSQSGGGKYHRATTVRNI